MFYVQLCCHNLGIFELNVDVVSVYNDFKEQGLILAALYGVVCVLFDG